MAWSYIFRLVLTITLLYISSAYLLSSHCLLSASLSVSLIESSNNPLTLKNTIVADNMVLLALLRLAWSFVLAAAALCAYIYVCTSILQYSILSAIPF